jgi:hypothetical protein
MPDEIKPGDKVRFYPNGPGKLGVVIEVIDKPRAIRVQSQGIAPEEWIVRPEDIVVLKFEQPF